MEIETLLAAVSAAAPCGEDLAFSSELDAIARARQADDPSIEQGAWVTALKEADWKFVGAGCSRLLQSRSKDLRLAVWLAEASAKTDGLGGLAAGLRLTAGLCERYWDGLYPLAEEGDQEQRIGNLCWIAARAAQLIREVALTEGHPAYTLNDFAARAGADGGADLDGARRRTPGAFYRRLLEDCGNCQAALAALEGVVDARLGADAPGFTAARANLQDLLHFASPLAAEGGPTAAAPVALTAVGREAGVVAPLAAATPAIAEPVDTMLFAGPGPLNTRAEALAQLRAVAAFFRHTEPHSPVAYLADKAARWGEQPLHVWLRAVIKDDILFGQLEEMLGAPKPS